MPRAKAVFSIIWCVLWIAAAAYCLLTARGKVALRSPLGPEFVPKADAPECRFAVLGDCHSHRKSLKSFVETAAKRDIDFAVQLGDFVDYDENIAYRHFLNRLGKIPFPLFLVRGNHEAVDFALHDSNRFCPYISEPAVLLSVKILFSVQGFPVAFCNILQ